MSGYTVAGASSSIVSGKREQDAPATDLITAQSAKLESLKTHKKGLMQQLFPAPTAQPHTSLGHRPRFPSPEAVEA